MAAIEQHPAVAPAVEHRARGRPRLSDEERAVRIRESQRKYAAKRAAALRGAQHETISSLIARLNDLIDKLHTLQLDA